MIRLDLARGLKIVDACHWPVRCGLPPKAARALYHRSQHGQRSDQSTPAERVRRVLATWMRYDVIALDEVGYVPLAGIGAEFLFQVIADQAERATLVVTTNLPFSEWTQVFPNPRLCKALLDRMTDRADIIETGTDSYRFRRTLKARKKKGARGGDPVIIASASI
jgi:hypothetical protein